jgi:hypothetical protein
MVNCRSTNFNDNILYVKFWDSVNLFASLFFELIYVNNDLSHLSEVPFT